MTGRSSLRLLLLDDDPEMRILVRTLLAKELPRAELVEIDPANDQLPVSGSVLGSYDCVLLDYDWGVAGTGLEWLRLHGGQRGGPPVILLTGADDVYVAARAMKLGAADYLNKRDLTARRLAELITSATASRDVSIVESSDADPTTVTPVFAARANQPTIEGYQLGNLIGKGANAQVFLAERVADGLTVVLKFLNVHMMDANQDQIDRFIREAELVAQLEIPQVVRIYEQTFTADTAFIAMEYLPGGNLRDRITAGIAPAEAMRYLRELLLGLKAIHEVGVVHRDLKPGNVMFRKDGSLAIADFGLSRRLDSSQHLTLTGQIMGTPAYMSPEQGQGDLAVPASDMYSAGVILFEMLAGEKPFGAASLTGVIYKHITAPVPTLPEGLGRYQPLIDAFMAKNPADRPRNGAVALEMCAAFID